MNVTELKSSEKKDHYWLYLNGVNCGEWERSQLRHHIVTIDNEINVGL